MPVLTLTLNGANGKAHDWRHVSVPLNQIVTLLNVTKLDYLNVQDYGLRPINMRFHATWTGGHVKVYNDSGAQIDAEKLVYFSGEHAGTDTIPEITEAFAATTVSGSRMALGITTENIANAAEGNVATAYEMTDVDTSAATAIGDPVYLSNTVGGWTITPPALPHRLQVIGYVLEVDASTGRIQFNFPGYRVPYEYSTEIT